MAAHCDCCGCGQWLGGNRVPAFGAQVLNNAVFENVLSVEIALRRCHVRRENN